MADKKMHAEFWGGHTLKNWYFSDQEKDDRITSIWVRPSKYVVVTNELFRVIFKDKLRY
jgi:hypothetical protein